MKKTISNLSLGLLLCGANAFAASWTGYISDAHCGAKHTTAKPDAACVEKCVKGGADPVFVVDDKVYKINGADKVKDHLGHTVRISGALNGDTITVKSLKMVKAS